MHERVATKLEAMTTEEIAKAIDARKYWRYPISRFLWIGRYYAFTLFAVQFLLITGVGILWIFAVTVCVVVVERLTNRYTIKTYSTCEIVSYLMKRTPLEESRAGNGKQYLVGFLIFLFGYIPISMDFPYYWGHLLFLLGMVWVLVLAKTTDQILNRFKGEHKCIEHVHAGNGRIYLELQSVGPPERSFPGKKDAVSSARFNLDVIFPARFNLVIYAVIALTLFWSLFAYNLGGLEAFDEEHRDAVLIQGSVILAVVWPGFGSGAHEFSRFHHVGWLLRGMSKTLADRHALEAGGANERNR